MKNFRVSILVIFFLGVVVTFNTSGLQSKDHPDVPKKVGFYDVENTLDGNAYEFKNKKESDIDIPLPLKDITEQILYRKHYTISYNKDTRLPNWVAWHLLPNHTTGEVKRPGNAWHEDLDVPAPRATVADYKGSGWTRGHMCPAGDNKWDGEAMYNTFLFSNCCPQNANLNSGTWNQIEISTRRWAERWGDLYILCGPILGFVV